MKCTKFGGNTSANPAASLTCHPIRTVSGMTSFLSDSMSLKLAPVCAAAKRSSDFDCAFVRQMSNLMPSSSRLLFKCLVAPNSLLVSTSSPFLKLKQYLALKCVRLVACLISSLTSHPSDPETGSRVSGSMYPVEQTIFPVTEGVVARVAALAVVQESRRSLWRCGCRGRGGMLLARLRM